MKKLIGLFTLLAFLFTASSGLMAQEKTKKVKKKDNVETITCWASIDCGNCKAKIEKNIAYEKGVTDLEVNLEKKLVTVTYRKDKTSGEKIEKAIKDLGFKTEVIKPKVVEKEKKK